MCKYFWEKQFAFLNKQSFQSQHSKPPDAELFRQRLVWVSKKRVARGFTNQNVA